jgi:hypothetical protein
VLKPEKEGDLSGTPSSSAPEPEEVKTIQFRQGQGVYKLDGNVYEGEWVLDKMHGHGKILPFRSHFEWSAVLKKWKNLFELK